MKTIKEPNRLSESIAMPKRNSGRAGAMKQIIVSMLLFVFILSVFTVGSAESGNEYIRLANGVTPEMLCADYWKPENADDLLMTAEEIAALEENDLNRMLNRADSLNAEDLRGVLQNLANLKPEECFLNGKPVTQAYLDNLIENSNLDGIDPAMPLRYGWSVCRASLRALPSNDFLGETADDLFFDQMVSSDCLPYMPAIVVHESKDGEWYFAWFYEGGGWIRKENIALCPSRGDWIARQKEESFLVVTGREVRLNVDRACDAISGLLLPMGTKIPLLSQEDAPEHVAGRENYYSYVVKLPVRGENGMIEDVIALIPMCDDVHAGYLEYTTGNVLKQFFKRLGDRYGWAGLDYSNDCSGTVREAYRCFGFELPRNSSNQAQSALAVSTNVAESTPEEKLWILSETRPGSLLYFPGHIMVYLGMKNDVPFVISSVGSFATEDMEVGTVMSVNTVAVNSLLVHRRSGKSWLESITQIVSIA